MTDKRPDPKPRKRPHLWQSYLWWDELVQVRKRHLLRISSIEKGKSNMDAQIEQDIIEAMQLDRLICEAKKLMIGYGEMEGPVWEWLTSIRGLGSGSLAAQLMAQIDDIAKLNTVSKLWRYAGLAVLDGKAEGKDSTHYNRRLKSICWLIADQFIKQQTPVYVDLYYAEKEAQRRKYPEVICVQCDIPWEDCQKKKSHKRKYNDGHLHIRAMRKAVKIFLQHLWVIWREAEGLPVTGPYVQDVMGHTNIVEPALA